MGFGLPTRNALQRKPHPQSEAARLTEYSVVVAPPVAQPNTLIAAGQQRRDKKVYVAQCQLRASCQRLINPTDRGFQRLSALPLMKCQSVVYDAGVDNDRAA